MTNILKIAAVVMLLMSSLRLFADESQPVDPFFGVKDRKTKQKSSAISANPRAMVAPTDNGSGMPISKVIAMIAIFACLSAGIGMFALAAKQSQQSKPTYSPRKSTRKSAAPSEGAKFRLNEPYSDSKNIMDRMVDPLKRAGKVEEADVEGIAAGTAEETMVAAPRDVVDGSPVAVPNPPERPTDLEADGQTITSHPRLIAAQQTDPDSLSSGIAEVSNKTEATVVGSLKPAIAPAEFEAVTETKPRLISAESSEDQRPAKKRGRRTKASGGSDVA